ncbi:uncharacterized protein N7482_004883 [Penicillium canariense]|uniref:Uncharacterized protein n=1 Tax=Penicillium canariense TaxID=189055 RepID=A0A9W9I5K1_9EURO|nr:uncharacterized protein N7482_004883 [Penicillium canariense]KAJ5166102.1 hypothetical protein N7482_004883 [Penicillium canariense]
MTAREWIREMVCRGLVVRAGLEPCDRRLRRSLPMWLREGFTAGVHGWTLDQTPPTPPDRGIDLAWFKGGRGRSAFFMIVIGMLESERTEYGSTRATVETRSRDVVGSWIRLFHWVSRVFPIKSLIFMHSHSQPTRPTGILLAEVVQVGAGGRMTDR